MKDERVESLVEQMINGMNDKGNPSTANNQNDVIRIREFIDKLPGGFLIYKAHGKEEIIYANKALCRIFRCDTLDEFLELTGGSFKGLVYYEDLKEVEASIDAQISHSHDDMDYVEYRILGKDGKIRWVEDYGHFVHSQVYGDIYYVFISEATDKINRRTAERASLIKEKNDIEKKLLSNIEEYDEERKLIQREHLQRLEVIETLSVNYDSILYADLDADKILPYRLSTRLNKQFDSRYKTVNYLWFIEDYVKSWVHPDDRALVREKLAPAYIRKKLNEDQTFYLNFKVIENKEIKYLQLRLVNAASGGRVSQIAMGYRRVDEEVLQGMKQKQLLEDALNSARISNVAKNTFLSNMSHDVRTPLNAIFGYTSLAHKSADDPSSVNKYLDKIERAGKQILELVDRVLEISYIETQEFHIDERPCNVNFIADDVYKTILPQAKKKNISVTLDCSSVEQPDVFADKDKLNQILMQVAGNAVKFTEDGGKISLSVEEQESSLGEYATFRFIMKDTGIGMEKDFLKRIFEPFERENTTTTSGVFGSGLGLTIAKHIIEMMGGDIEVESEVGKGSTFTVTLCFRLQGKQKKHKSNKDDADGDLTGKKILLVEDNEINLEIERDMLEDIGIIVDSAENGKIAVEKVAAAECGEYALVLMDIQMPVMDGREATREIRKLEGGKGDVPIIALSANAFESDKRQSLESGMDDHLTKPIDIPVLLEAVAEVFKSRN